MQQTISPKFRASTVSKTEIMPFSLILVSVLDPVNGPISKNLERIVIRNVTLTNTRLSYTNNIHRNNNLKPKRNSFTEKACDVWNGMPDFIKNINNWNTCKFLLKNHIFMTYQSEPECEKINCYSCEQSRSPHPHPHPHHQRNLTGASPFLRTKKKVKM